MRQAGWDEKNGYRAPGVALSSVSLAEGVIQQYCEKGMIKVFTACIRYTRAETDPAEQ